MNKKKTFSHQKYNKFHVKKGWNLFQIPTGAVVCSEFCTLHAKKAHIQFEKSL